MVCYFACFVKNISCFSRAKVMRPVLIIVGIYSDHGMSCELRLPFLCVNSLKNVAISEKEENPLV